MEGVVPWVFPPETDYKRLLLKKKLHLCAYYVRKQFVLLCTHSSYSYLLLVFLEFCFVQSLNMVLFSDNTSEECIEDHTECYDEKKFRIVLDNLKETRNFGDYYVCIWGEHKTQEGFKFYHPDDFFSNKILPCGFEIDIKTTACLYTEPGDSDYFSTIGCQVLRESDNDRTWCACNHLSSFTGAVMPAVPRVDLTAAAFDPRVMYPVYVLLGSLWLTFFLLLLILRSKDKSDVEKVRICAHFLPSF